MNAAEIEMQETLRLLDEAVSEMRRLRARAAAADQLADALRDVEWGYTGEEECPYCARERTEGHVGGCAIAVALDEYEAARNNR